MTVTATPATIRVHPSTPSRAIGADLTLNYLPARFTDATFDAGTLEFESREQLRQLRLNLAATHTVTKLGNQIVCVPYVDGAELVGDPISFHTADDLDLTVRLLRAAIIRLLTQPPWAYRLRSFAPPEFVSRLPGRDLMIPALAGIHGCEGLHVFPKFTLDTRRTGPCGLPGILIGLKTHYEIDNPISELVQRGVSVTARAALAVPTGATAGPGQDPTVLRRLRGIITAADLQQLRVDTGDEIISIPAAQAWLEARRDVFHEVLAALCGASAEHVLQRLHRGAVGILGAEGRLARTKELGERLRMAGPFTIANGVQAQLAPPVGSSDRAHQVTSRTVAEPIFVFDMAGGKQRRYADPGLSECGPFDADGFRRKSPRIAVIVPSRYTQQAQKFMRAFRDGVPDSDAFSQGFVRKFRLKDCTFQVTTFDGGPRDADAYRQACLDAVTTEPAPDLAVVIISQQQEQLTGDASPYLVAKATLMSHGVPVQQIQVETIDRRDLAQPLNTLALACYAKLGGTPYVISVPEPNVEHELVIGIGSAHIKQHRMGSRQRYVGITSVFSCDGNYYVSTISKDATYEQYPTELMRALRTCIEEVKTRNGWQPQDRMRLIFHVFKQLKDSEARAVKEAVQELVGALAGENATVDFAFLTVSDDHDWMLLDGTSTGVSTSRGQKGRYVPARGHIVAVSASEVLVSAVGPRDLKLATHGAPRPLLVRLHRESTFTDVDYLAEQVFRFTAMSWRRPYSSSRPVTTMYSDLIATLLGKLRAVTNWNSDIIATKLRWSRWFL